MVVSILVIFKISPAVRMVIRSNSLEVPLAPSPVAVANNTLIADNVANTWNVNGTERRKCHRCGEFTNIQNLVGGNSTNDFVMANNGAVIGTINGTSGSGNTIDYSAYSTAVTIT